MEKITTAEEFLIRQGCQRMLCDDEDHDFFEDVQPSNLIEFAKLHVEAALKEASEKAKLAKAFDYGSYYESTANFKPIDDKVVVEEQHGHGDSGYSAIKVDTDSILNSYSLENIK